MERIGLSLLAEAGRTVIDYALEDMAVVHANPEYVETETTAVKYEYFPPSFVGRLVRWGESPARDVRELVTGFFSSWATAVIVTADRMADDDWSPGCTAEEVALWEIIAEAKLALDGNDDVPYPQSLVVDRWLELFRDERLEDHDVRMLWSPELDGIEDDERISAELRVANLRMPEWFIPFRPSRCEAWRIPASEIGIGQK